MNGNSPSDISNVNGNLVGFQVASSIDRNCCGSYKGIPILHPPCLHRKGWLFLPDLMDVTTGNSPFSEKQTVEPCKALEEGKEAVGKDANTSLFVNHAAVAWHESRRKWVGDQTQRSPKVLKDEIISWSTTYEELLSTNEPFSEPIPLPEMVDFLVDIWHDEGLFD
ncbi:uncharacterized protein LOC115667002 isoform X2 [Syzygium oleosum]|uniref:uncharacterized protein LOC115667002 isoform X2 n=1 Tax=Syzygium oleosum TaxID=219896 RepID=UPI0011D217EF|nr:uncharacterized protein LOC115667002 isoform X2 [Syzygium oleosum]